MSCRRVQYNAGPGILDIKNLVPGDAFHITITIDHDITNSIFEGAVISSRDESLITALVISGVTMLPSGILDISISAEETALITEDALWYFNETASGVKRTLLAGNVEVFQYD